MCVSRMENRVSEMSHAMRPAEEPEYWTLDGLANWFGISKHLVSKYRAWGLIPKALGKFPNGLNYDYTHFEALAAVRAEMEARNARIPLRELGNPVPRRTTPHTIIRTPREDTR